MVRTPSNDALSDSPCVGVCVVNGRLGVCRGCGRRLGEIAGWSRFSAEQRREILAQLPVRLHLADLPE